jgi:D-threo-aldose 1-dehydrogenase
MTAWTPEQLGAINANDDLFVSPLREDGYTYGTPTQTWALVVDGNVYVRAANGPTSRWYTAAMSQGAGRVRVGGRFYDVVFEAAGTENEAAIDKAYEAKYPGSSAVPIMQGPAPKAAAVRISPRPRSHAVVSPHWEMNRLGSTGLSVSPITVGGGPLGSMPESFGYDVAERDAIDLVLAILDSEIRTIDTSNGYSNGRSEERIGKAIAEYGGLPADALVITKVDARGTDYSGDRVRRSLAESSHRLGIAPLPVVHLHDPEFHDFEMITAPGGAVDALVAAKDRGDVGHIGLAGGDVREMARYIELGVFEILLVHNRWTLVDRSAGDLIERATELGMAVVNAAVLGGGILADSSGASTSYGYRPARPDTLKAINRMRAVCRDWGTDLATAAIRFSTRQPRISSTIVGISKISRIESTIAAATAEFPEEFWSELEALLPSAENWLDAGA